MTYELLIKPAAEEDIFDAAIWYQEKRENLGTRFISFLDQAFDKIRVNPNQYPIKYKKTRVALLKVFPFGIHYMVEGDKIVVLAVLHTSRNPKISKDR